MLSANVAGQADGRARTSDNCGGYSGYSEDIAVDNVSSPKPRTYRGYSEDTQIRAGDNGGYARGYHDLFVLLAAWQIPLRPSHAGPAARIFMHRRSCRELTNLPRTGSSSTGTTRDLGHSYAVSR